MATLENIHADLMEQAGMVHYLAEHMIRDLHDENTLHLGNLLLTVANKIDATAGMVEKVDLEDRRRNSIPEQSFEFKEAA